MRLLLITRDRALGTALSQHLLRDDHVVDWFESARALSPLIDSGLYHCLVLDAEGNDAEGEDLLGHALRPGNGTGTVVVAPAPDVGRRVDLLDRGVDDVLSRPLDLEEAGARIRRAGRRRHDGAAAEEAIQFGPLSLAASRREVRWFGRPVTLTRKEYGLLEVFLRSRGRVLSRARLEDALYGLETEIASNAVEVHIHHLRRKLAREVIVSVRSVGYQLGPVLSRHA